MSRFRGPNGLEMIVNCLPLYDPPPMGREETDSGASKIDVEISVDKGSPSPSRVQTMATDGPARKSFSLIKARSENALDTVAAELELHDHDCEVYKSEESVTRRPVAIAPRKWSKMSTSYAKNLTVLVHRDSVDNTQDMVRSKSQEALMGDGDGRRNIAVGGSDSVKAMAEKSDLISSEAESKASLSISIEESGESNDSSMTDPSESGNETCDTKPEHMQTPKHVSESPEMEQEQRLESKVELAGEGIQSKDPKMTLDRVDSEPEVFSQGAEQQPLKNEIEKKRASKKNTKKLRTSKSESPTAFEDIESDDDCDGQQLQVNYLDPPTMSTLKRGSGSVSFFSRPHHLITSVEKRRDNGLLTEEASIQESDAPSLNTKLPLVEDAPSLVSQPDSSPSAPPLATPNSSALLPQATPTNEPTTTLLVPSPLPVPPSTLDPTYIERSGWMNKLSHRRGMFGDKWQKRYFVLHRSWLYYFKKYGVSMTPLKMIYRSSR